MIEFNLKITSRPLPPPVALKTLGNQDHCRESVWEASIRQLFAQGRCPRTNQHNLERLF